MKKHAGLAEIADALDSVLASFDELPHKRSQIVSEIFASKFQDVDVFDCLQKIQSKGMNSNV